MIAFVRDCKNLNNLGTSKFRIQIEFEPMTQIMHTWPCGPNKVLGEQIIFFQRIIIYPSTKKVISRPRTYLDCCRYIKVGYSRKNIDIIFIAQKMWCVLSWALYFEFSGPWTLQCSQSQLTLNRRQFQNVFCRIVFGTFFGQ